MALQVTKRHLRCKTGAIQLANHFETHSSLTQRACVAEGWHAKHAKKMIFGILLQTTELLDEKSNGDSPLRREGSKN